jgi:hypothetical protein
LQGDHGCRTSDTGYRRMVSQPSFDQCVPACLAIGPTADLGVFASSGEWLSPLTALLAMQVAL